MGGCATKPKQQRQSPDFEPDAFRHHDNNNEWTKDCKEHWQPQQLPSKYQSRPLPGVLANRNLALHSNASSRTVSPHSPVTCRPDSEVPAGRRLSGCLQRGTVVVAIFDYAARTEGELSFAAGDVMRLLDVVDCDWWYVEQQVGCECGYIPVALVAVQHSLESKRWYFGSLARKEAERHLLADGNRRGCFLVRESETHRESYSLSVLDAGVDGSSVVKHYRIRQLDRGAGFFITSRQKFASMQALVENYSARQDGLCCLLTAACPKQAPTIADLSYQTRDQWEIPRSQLQLSELLGSGQFGQVWRAVYNGRLPVAVKTLKSGCCTRQEFLKEARVMKRLRHPKLVQLFAVCTDGDPVFIVTELMSHGSLLGFLRNRRLQLQALADILAQVASGMAYLEAEKFVHRDLAARNILVGDNNVAKVADFGLSRAIADTGEYTAREGAKFPIKWTSPEAALRGRFSVKSDVWSFGIVAFETVTHGQVPYAGMSNMETLSVVEKGYRMPRPPDCPQQLYDVMFSCWMARPDDRPTFAFLADFFDNFLPASEPNYRQAECAQTTPQVV